MILKRIEPFSCAKISGLAYAVLGLVVAAFFAMFASCGAMLGGGMSEFDEFPFIGGLIGVGSFVFFPILYGVIGFIGGLLMAIIYNWLAGLFGGIEVEFETEPSEEVS